jgi:hypothetical protein
MKNILAENMLRFGSKNLSGSDVETLQKLMEQTEPNLGFAVGNAITLKNVTVEGFGPGDLIVQDNSIKGSRSFPSFQIAAVKYVPPMVPIDAAKGIYKNAAGQQQSNVSLSSAAAKVKLDINAGNISFVIVITGGKEPYVSASSFKEVKPNYEFLIDKLPVNKDSAVTAIKNALGNSNDNTSRTLTNTMFGSQDWVKTAQAALPQS